MNNNSGIKILLVDIVPPVSLAVTRSLGKEGFQVYGTSHVHHGCPAGISKYMRHVFQTASTVDFKAFVEDIISITEQNNFDCIIPLSEPALNAITTGQDRIKSTYPVLVPPHSSCAVGLSKHQTLEFARRIGIRIPQSFYPQSLDDVNDIATKLEKFPVVIKGELGGNINRIHYANSKSQLVESYRAMVEKFPPASNKKWPMIQEYIEGVGVGYFGLFYEGKEKAFFMHQRILEYPETGGPSSIAESISEEDLRQQGRLFLSQLDWHGLAMIEFKKERGSGELVLMEINPRPWGSMALPISLGINFPLWMAKLTMGENREFPCNYQTARRFIWMFPNCMMNIIANPKSLSVVGQSYAKYKAKTEVDIHDLRPLLSQIRLFLYGIKTLIKQKRPLRFPQGKV